MVDGCSGYDSSKLTPHREMAERNKILVIRTGSHLYGTNTPSSDEDYSGIFIPDIEYVFGLKNIEEVDFSIISKGEDGKNTSEALDKKYYAFRKFVRLAADCNPNILEQLFVNESNVVFINELGRRLLDNRHMFPSKLLMHRFLGYAYSQRHKMVIRTDKFNELSAAYEYFSNENPKKLMAEFREKNLPFMEFKTNHVRVGDLDFPMGRFVKNVVADIEERLSKVGNRKELVTKYGYDVKFASHLIRLLIEAKELLETGELRFPLRDKDLIMSIKNGKMDIHNILEMAESLENDVREIEKKSNLKYSCDELQLNKFVIKVFEDFYTKPYA